MQERIDPEKLHVALSIFKKLGNHFYKDITDNVDGFLNKMLDDDHELFEQLISSSNVENGVPQHDDDNRQSNLEKEQKKEARTEEEIEEEEEDKFNKNDTIQRQKFNDLRPTMFVNDFPELNIETVRHAQNEHSNDQDITVTVAPGENQVPTNIVHEQHWESKSYPALFPNGKYDFHDKDRPQKISMQQYFDQRVMNCDRRFSRNSSYLFSAFACNEKNVLECNIGIAGMKGKVGNSSLNTLQDPYKVLEQCPGTPIYMRKKKYELIARLENLGPFHLFFTLSCGEKRYNENFTPFFKEHPELDNLVLRLVFENGREQIEVKVMGTADDWEPMEKVLKEKYQAKHEMIRQNVLSQTLTFDHRVKEFIKTIMMNKQSPFSVKYYSYRVEFQLRGAAHIHGTIWVDFEKYFEREIEKESNGELTYKQLKKTKSYDTKKTGNKNGK